MKLLNITRTGNKIKVSRYQFPNSFTFNSRVNSSISSDFSDIGGAEVKRVYTAGTGNRGGIGPFL